MKEFHITITNNETGETIHDIDSDAILGVIGDDDHTWDLCLTSCDTNTLLNALDRMEKVAEYVYKKNPELFFFLKIMQKKRAKETEEATDETTEN